MLTPPYQIHAYHDMIFKNNCSFFSFFFFFYHPIVFYGSFINVFGNDQTQSFSLSFSSINIKCVCTNSKFSYFTSIENLTEKKKKY